MCADRYDPRGDVDRDLFADLGASWDAPADELMDSSSAPTTAPQDPRSPDPAPTRDTRPWLVRRWRMFLAGFCRQPTTG